MVLSIIITQKLLKVEKELVVLDATLNAKISTNQAHKLYILKILWKYLPI